MRDVQRFYRRHRWAYLLTVATLTLLAQVFGMPWQW